MGIFEYIGNWITELFDFLKSSSNTEVVQALSTLVGLNNHYTDYDKSLSSDDW